MIIQNHERSLKGQCQTFCIASKSFKWVTSRVRLRCKHVLKCVYFLSLRHDICRLYADKLKFDKMNAKRVKNK